MRYGSICLSRGVLQPHTRVPHTYMTCIPCVQLLEALFVRVASQRAAASLACSSRRLRVLSRSAAVTSRILPLPKLDFDELKASSEQRLASCASSFPGLSSS